MTIIMEPSTPNALLADGVDVGSIDYSSLPEVPSFYPIERTSAVVDCCNPHEIATRIICCLQKLSIIAPFNSEDASFFAEAVDHTKFYIRLYKSNNKSILVEFQRLDGNSFDFVEYARVILAAARGETVDGRIMVKSSSLNFIPAPCHANKCHQPDDVCAEYMMHIEELLQNYRSDAVILGVESILLLTDQERSQVSLCAAEAVLHGKGHPVVKNFIHKCILDSCQSDILHNTALAALGNSLQTALDAECSVLSTLVQSDEWMEQSGLVDALLYELSQAHDRSHDAYHAARCLNALLDSSPDMKKTLEERGLPRIMKDAQAVGRKSHSLLVHECDAGLALMADV